MRKQTNFRLSEETLDLLDALAKAQNVTKTDIIEHAVAKIDEQQKNPSMIPVHPIFEYAGTLEGNQRLLSSISSVLRI